MPNNCESYSVQINNTYKELALSLLTLFTEFNSQNESLVVLLDQYSDDINGNKESIVDILDEYLLLRMNCCYNIVVNIDQITALLGQIPCIDQIENIPVTTEEVTTTVYVAPTTTLDETICNFPLSVDEQGVYYPYTTNKFLGAVTGLVTMTFNAHDIPVRYVVTFDGVDVIDTGYVGDPSFQVYLDAAVYLQGDVAGDITDLSTGTLYFNKDTATDTATVTIYSPLSNSRFEFTMSCPDNSASCLDIALDVLEIDFTATTTVTPTTTVAPTTTVEPTTTIEPTTTTA